MFRACHVNDSGYRVSRHVNDDYGDIWVSIKQPVLVTLMTAKAQMLVTLLTRTEEPNTRSAHNTRHVIDIKRGDSRHVNDRNGKEERKDIREILVTLVTVNIRLLVTLLTGTDNARIGKTVWWSSR